MNRRKHKKTILVMVALIVVVSCCLLKIEGVKTRSLAKEEFCLKMIEMQEELEAILPFLEDFDEYTVIINDKSRISENWFYYLEFDNEQLNNVFEVFGVNCFHFTKRANGRAGSLAYLDSLIITITSIRSR